MTDEPTTPPTPPTPGEAMADLLSAPPAKEGETAEVATARENKVRRQIKNGDFTREKKDKVDPKKKPKKKESKRGQPTPMMKRVAAALMKQVSEGKRTSRTKAMIEAGYSEASAKVQTVTRSQAFRDLMKKVMPDEEVNTIHKALMNSYVPKTVQFPGDIEDETLMQVMRQLGWQILEIKRFMNTKYVVAGVPDNFARKSALELWHKIEGTLVSDKNDSDRIKQMGEILREVAAANAARAATAPPAPPPGADPSKIIDVKPITQPTK